MPHQNQWWSIMMRWLLLTTKLLFFVVALVIWNINKEREAKTQEGKTTLCSDTTDECVLERPECGSGNNGPGLYSRGSPSAPYHAANCHSWRDIHIIYEHYYGEKETFALFDAERSETHVFVIGIKGIVLVCTLTSSTSFFFAFFVVDWLDRQ